jgi:hypothetical protein
VERRSSYLIFVINPGGLLRKLATLLVVAVVVGVSAAHAGEKKQAWQWKYKVWMPQVWQRIAHCESGTRPPRDPNWKHNSGTFQGAFGFHYGSWDDFRPRGYPSEAYNATPWQQYRVALRIHARYRFTGWGCYKNAWVRYG